jgi:hypothetical protein
MCGFKKGENNIAKNIYIKKLISDNVKLSYTPELRKKRSIQRSKMNQEKNFGELKYKNSIGEIFRSKLEVYLSEIFIRNNIKYEYEVPIKMKNGKYKVIDFKVDNILIEVTGYAYKKWQIDFNKKISCLRYSVDNQIMVLTYPENLKKIYCISKRDLYTGNIYNEKDILEKIEFCNNMEGLKCY